MLARFKSLKSKFNRSSKIVYTEYMKNLEVLKIVDGDTIWVRYNGNRLKIRLLTIDTPEVKQDYGPEATLALKTKIEDRRVNLKKTGLDRYGRTLATVFMEDRNICEELVKEGHAWVYKLYREEWGKLMDLEKSAREDRIGLWNMETPIAPWEWRKKNKFIGVVMRIVHFIDRVKQKIRISGS
jgi:micrococcal nuclease